MSNRISQRVKKNVRKVDDFFASFGRVPNNKQNDLERNGRMGLIGEISFS